VEPLNVTTDVSNSTHGHKMSAYMLSKTYKVYCVKTHTNWVY